ncbi:DUF3967 domain-containing protein [Bacillus weihaiensis]|uniref:DUF3967 domain-containing protein n=1 Tax=Bacillus weihaiensis TaxID=1547283 RepID=A0A1L3MXZ1_9BACI|nr:DUF3967 domain-containing protein [Bacillus weihaiensis]APH07205.1 hypothetical protein A9C19_20675 [Bacillus weihaiensis]
MSGTEKPLSSKEVSSILDIGDSTLRKWCIAIEEQDYFFSRTDGNRRLFFSRDLELLRNYRKYVQVQNISMSNAAKLVVEGLNGIVEQENEVENKKNTVLSDRSNNEVIDRLMNYIEQQEERQKQQEEFNKALLNKLDEQQKYIEERLNKRDDALMQSLREVQETRKLIAAAEEKREEESKKGFFQRLLGK